jgi:3-dehydroquinate synthase
MGIDIRYSMEMGWMSADTGERILETISRLGLPLTHTNENEDLLVGLEEFREHLGGRLCIASLRDIGDPFDLSEIDAEVMKRVLASA